MVDGTERGGGQPHEGLGGYPVAPHVLLEHLPDAVAVLGPDGSVVWANEQTARVLGLPLHRLIGADGLARVHPDDLAKALDGIAWAEAFPERTAVVPFRLERADGTYVTAELKSTVVKGAEGDHLILVLRDGTTRTTLAQALASIASGEPIAETARWLVRSIESRWPYTQAAVAYDDDEGRRSVCSTGLAPELEAPLLDEIRAEEYPWERAAVDGTPLVAEGEGIPRALRTTAEGFGLRACACAAAEDPLGRSAAIVAWFDEPAAAHLEWVHWAAEVSELLVLALERRAQRLQLVERAQRDPLTGLLNRTGLFESVAKLVEGSAEGDHLPVVGLLYVDLDGFKPVNDRFGHVTGDEVLAEIAARLAVSAPAALVARLGGDEFAVVALGHSGPGGFGPLADGLLDAIASPVAIADTGDVVLLTASIGIARLDADALRADRDALPTVLGQALQVADAAMYDAKRMGRGRWKMR